MRMSTRPELDAVPCCKACQQVQDTLRWLELQRVMRHQQIVILSTPFLGLALAFLIIYLQR